MIAAICTFPRLPCPSTKRRVMLNLTSAAAAAAAAAAVRTAGWSCSVFFFFKQKTAYEMLRSLVGSEMCIRDSATTKGDIYVPGTYTKFSFSFSV